MYILWISCSHSGDNAPQQVPRAGELAGVLSGALPPECKQAYPQGYTQGSKTAAFTLTHRDDDDYGHVPLVVPFRQSIGIDWFEKIQPKSRRSTRAIRAPGYESYHPPEYQHRAYRHNLHQVRNSTVTAVYVQDQMGPDHQNNDNVNT